MPAYTNALGYGCHGDWTTANKNYQVTARLLNTGLWTNLTDTKYAESADKQQTLSIAHPYAGEAEERVYGDAETELMLTTGKFNDVIAHAYQELAPHKICQYIYELANAFNSFYHGNKIMSEEDKALDELDEKKNKVLDAVFNGITAGVFIAAIIFAVIYFLL